MYSMNGREIVEGIFSAIAGCIGVGKFLDCYV
jgi:hypothetical protein